MVTSLTTRSIFERSNQYVFSPFAEARSAVRKHPIIWYADHTFGIEMQFLTRHTQKKTQKRQTPHYFGANSFRSRIHVFLTICH